MINTIRKAKDRKWKGRQTRKEKDRKRECG